MALGVDLQHPAWTTAAGTVAAYLLVLGVLFVVMFAVPYLLFSL